MEKIEAIIAEISAFLKEQETPLSEEEAEKFRAYVSAMEDHNRELILSRSTILDKDERLAHLTNSNKAFIRADKALKKASYGSPLFKAMERYGQNEIWEELFSEENKVP